MSAAPGRTLFVPDGRKEVPASALFISLLCLAVAALGNFLWPERLPQVFALLWLLSLIPPFLLAYYRGWEGAALALVVGMVLLIGVEVGGSYLGDRQVRWWIVGGVIVVLVTVSLGVGMISESLHRRESAALDLAYSDHLTGLPNRRVLELFLRQAFASAQRGGELSVALFDIDGFKEHNDTRGHSVGDEVLRLVAAILAANTRASDVAGRLGGDEFLAILPGEDAESALTFGTRIQSLLKTVGRQGGEEVTLSVGIATFRPEMAGPDELIEAADRALYRAKARGGNRAALQGDEEAPPGTGRAAPEPRDRAEVVIRRPRRQAEGT